MVYTEDLGVKQGEARQIQLALLNLVLHSRVHGRRTCGSIGNRLLCTYKSVILHRAAATDHDDSNTATSHTVNKETTRGGSLVQGGEGGTNVLRSAGKRVRGSIPAHGHVAAAFRGMGVKGGEMGGVIFYIGVAKY